jgi:hypothetical protein
MDTQVLILLPTFHHSLSVFLLYAGPDQLLPLMSALGAIVGVLLVFWQRFVGSIRRASQFFISRLRVGNRKKV